MPKAPDVAHQRTDKLLEELEKELTGIYGQAARESAEKLNKWLEKFTEADKKQKELLDAGKISAKDFQNWRFRHMMMGKRWEELRDTLAQDFHNVNQIAVSTANGYMPEVYALNHNYATYQIEHDGKLDTSYSLYDRQTVERLVRDNPKLLPDPTPGGKTARRLAENKDLRWNRQHIQNAVLQGILQGEPIDAIADRLQSVAEMNRNAAVRSARTMTTGAQNGGRQDGYKRAEGMGIQLQKRWIATLDGRTRHEHRLLHGQTVPTDEPFTVDGEKIMFPGDPSAPGYLVYNCRCTMGSQIKGYETDVVKSSPKMGDMSFSDWLEAKADTRNQPAIRKGDQELFADYKALLGKNAPKTFGEFQDIKYDNPEKWAELKRLAREARRK